MDFAITIDNQTGVGQMTFNQVSDMRNNIYTSWMIKQGSFFPDLKRGSRFYLLERNKATVSTMNKAIGYGKEALQWLLDAKKAQSIEVYAQYDFTLPTKRLKLLAEVTPISGADPIPFSTFIEVI